MILAFFQGGICDRSLEGRHGKKKTSQLQWVFVGILNAGAAITIFVYTLTTAITPLFNVWRLGPT